MSMVPPLDMDELDLLVTQTRLSPEEVRESYSRFCTASHGANIITRQVFSDIMSKCFPRTYKVACILLKMLSEILVIQEELEADIFSLYDLNGNGYIEFTEFLLIITMMNEGTAKTKLELIFK